MSKHFAIETPFHGVLWVKNAGRNSLKLFWLFMILLSLVGFGYQSYNSVAVYLSEQPSTTYTVSNKREMQLPAIEICPPARFNSKRLKELSISNDVAELLHFAFIGTFLKSRVVTSLGRMYDGWVFVPEQLPRLIAAQSELTAILVSNNMTLSALIEALSIHCEDMVQECWSNEQLYDQEACWSAAQPFMSSMGRCVLFEEIPQLFAAPGMGRAVALEVPWEDLHRGFGYPYKGVMVRTMTIGNSTYEPSVNMVIFAPLNSKVNIMIGATEGTFLSTKKNPCRKKKPGQPSAEFCSYTCMMRELFVSAECRAIDVTSQTTQQICQPMELVHTLMGAMRSDDQIKDAQKACVQAPVRLTVVSPHTGLPQRSCRECFCFL